MKRHRRDYEMIADMNLTNLLDTAFVLLIAFIIASPTMRHGLRVDLPEVAETPTLNSTPDTKPILISIKKQRDLANQPEWVYVGDERVDLKGLTETIRAKKMISPNKKIDVILEMDKDGRYEALAQVLSVMRTEGIDAVGLPMIPEEFGAGAVAPLTKPTPAPVAEPDKKDDQKKKRG